ncbi:MAG: ABC transporter ATP-binding protein [Chloroflexi bacterium]|nr:ABC transporter ATP-binding protein [Chloroflexota bacterium]MBV9480671.1 ABC transporter ATP-binding protein [Acidobacteriota bacterium]MBV9595566.1 ABC transporter ATP-binding protein [Chloroflexota bacterium]
MTLRPGEITAIIGANASGKSTLLRGLARLLRPSTGAVLIDGCDVARLPTREVATRIGVLSQLPVAPGGLSVGELVARGRYPHQGWFRQWSPEDERGVRDALAATQMSELADRRVDELSGGQRQRAWIAMALAQDTDILLLDEPTTFLDIAHQIEILDLLVDLNATSGRTIAVVLHDLNQACRYADHLIAMSCGQIAAEGRPAEILTTALVKKVFNIECRLIPDPATGLPLIVPVSSRTPLDKRTTHWCCPAPADRFGKEDQAAALRR